MKDWEKIVVISADEESFQVVRLCISMGASGPKLTMVVGGERVVIAKRWQNFTTLNPSLDLMAAIAEGARRLQEG